MNPLALANEKDVLLRMQKGDEHAFKLLYDHYAKFIYRNLLKLVKVPDVADELTQILFVKIWRKRDGIDIEISFSHYILRMGSNLVCDFYRKAARDNRLQDEIIAKSTELYSHVEEEIFYKQGGNR